MSGRPPRPGVVAPEASSGLFRPLEAVLWDLDGTLVDTEPYWHEAEFALAAEYGGTWTSAQALALTGSDLLVSARQLREQGGVDLTPTRIAQELLDRVVARMERRVPWRVGALELLTDLRRAGVRCALVTSSYRRLVAPVLAALPAGSFEVVVTGDAVGATKPDPEPYRTAAALLGVQPGRTVAIEDSDVGTRSAEAAGCTVLVVPQAVPVPPGPRRILADGLTGMDSASFPRPLGG